MEAQNNPNEEGVVRVPVNNDFYSSRNRPLYSVLMEKNTIALFVMGALFLMWLGIILEALNVDAFAYVFLYSLGTAILTGIFALTAILKEELNQWVRFALIIAMALIIQVAYTL